MSAVMLGHRSQLRSRSRSRQSSVSACCEGVEDCLGTHLICCTDETCEETLPTSNSSSASSASSSLLTENKSRDLENEQDCPECRDGFPAEVVCCTGDKCLEVEEECAECEKDNETVQIEGKEDANLVPCDVPGCSVLEWDEKTVNELLRCCCSSETVHHHQSFTTPYASMQNQYRHSASLESAKTVISAADISSAFSYTIPSHLPHQDSTWPSEHLHHHNTADANLLQKPSLVGNTVIDATDATIKSQYSTPSNSSTPAFTFSSPALSALSASSLCTAQPYQHSHGVPLTHSQLHTHIQAHGQHAIHEHVPPNISHEAVLSKPQAPLPSSDMLEVYRCEWSQCTSTFPSRESLIGHVNANHLMQAEPTLPSVTTFSQLPLHHSPDFQSQHSLMTSTSRQMNSNEHDATALADSFDSTLKCLWSACEPNLSLSPNTSATPSKAICPASDAVHSSIQPSLSECLPHSDQPTATLVRHLLQDHLHFPSELLGQYSPSLQQALEVHGFHQQSRVTASGPIPSNSVKEISLVNDHGIALAGSFAPLPLPPPPSPSMMSDASLHSRVSSVASIATAPGFSFDNYKSIDPSTAINMSDEPSYFSSMSTSSAYQTQSHACNWVSCNLSFLSTSALMKHIISTHIGSGQSTYHCEWEGCERGKAKRGFNQRQKVVRHVRTHVGDKPFTCTRCGRGFSESTTLAQHMRTHTNERPYPCPHCGKSFAIQSALTIHLRTHSGEKPFKCPHEGCGMTFAESSNLSKHAKTHRERSETGGTGEARKRTMSMLLDSEDEKVSKVCKM